MSVTTQEQQVREEHRNLIGKQMARVKRIIHCSFKNIASPGAVPDNTAVIGSYLAIALIFVLDVVTHPAISFHILYVFPLSFIALHSSRTSLAIGAVALSISLALIQLFFFQTQFSGIPVCLFLLIAFSNIICTLGTRYCRAHMLEAKRQSTIDPLTQLCNRRGLDKAMEAESKRQRRYGDHFSVVIIDLDGFKGLNDSKGHKAGDDALILVADILRNQLRQTDVIARLGGDEFVVLMPNTGATDCQTLCQLLCQTIRARLTQACSYPLSASMGFTTVENSAQASSDILSIADEALYRAKALGKSCVVRG